MDIPVPASGTLPEKTTRRLWGQDRAALVECGMRLEGYDRFVMKRDGALGGETPR